MTKVFELYSTIKVDQFKWIIFIVKKFQEIITFVTWYLEGHLPFIDKIIAFSFLAKVLRWLPQKSWGGSELLSFSINSFVKKPIALNRRFPEFNSITNVGIEEFPKFIGDWDYMNLKMMQYIIEKFPSRMNEVHDNYDFPNALKIGNLIYTTSYSKQFSFSSCDINYVIDWFDDLFVMNIDMRDGSSNLISYAGIRYHKSNQGIQRGSKSDIVKGLNMYSEIFVALFTWSVKRKMIWEDINEAMTLCEFLVKQVKRRKNFIKPVVHVKNRAFDF